ncbi:concanavalin A-like lectin/glucanase domain-containing protein [Amylocystis lapponica]|nr:concanavalin A-like lectin/glucanase domain-containing protein [Amylocystis lapponica]
MARRSSLESLRLRSQPSATPLVPGAGVLSPPNSSAGTTYPAGYGLVRAGSDIEELGRPYAPFMEGGGSVRDGRESPSLPHSPSQSQLYRESAAGAMSIQGYNEHGLPRKASNPNITMRAPFLSPASRPGSSLWSPPSFPYPYPPASASFTGLSGTQTPTYGYDIHAHLRKARPPMPSHFLPEKLGKEDKPWLLEKDKNGRVSWWLTFLFMFIGIAGAAVYIYFGWTSVLLLKDGDLCQVLDEEFDSLDMTNTWTADVELGGFGNGEFQMTTTKSKNLYVNNGELYIMPTLTSDEIGEGSLFDGYTYSLDGCTTANQTACSVTSSNDSGIVVNPVQSARISTQKSYSIQYGRVEVRAKLPRGDWLWPAIWMLPVENKYGVWPLSGEIDLMEARGNDPTYGAQGVNYVRSSLNYGPLDTLITQIFGWWSMKHATYADEFHTYMLEWTPDWVRLSVDSRIHDMLQLRVAGKGGKSFWTRGGYPATAQNGSATEVVVEDIWSNAGGGASAPFDQNFYLILDVAAGGTSGWFPDNVGGKPWYDTSGTAMREFAEAQGTWSATWPSDDSDRAFRVDSVKMWKLGGC